MTKTRDHDAQVVNYIGPDAKFKGKEIFFGSNSDGGENNRIVIQSKLFFDDPDPSTSTYGQLTYSFGGLPSGLTVNDAGRIRGRLPEGTYTFTVTATDGGNLSTQQTFTIIIGKPGKPG